MKRMLTRLLIAASLACSLPAQQSVWLPSPGHVLVSPVFVRQSFRDIWMGSQPMRLGDGVAQLTGAVSAEVGVARNVAVDMTVGYSRVSSSAFDGPNSDAGFVDTQFGIRRQFYKGSRRRPAMAVRVGGIVRGNYTANYPFSAGDGGSGVETSILTGHSFGESGFGAYGDIGYRIRNRGIPADIFGTAGIHKTFRPATLSFAYHHGRGLRGSDIGDPGFRFPGLREIHHTLEGGLGFSGPGRHTYQVFVARTVHGRNTGDKIVAGIAAQFDFRIPWRR